MMFDRKFRPDTFSSAYTVMKLCLLAFNASRQVIVSTTDKIPPKEGFNAPQYSFLVTIILYFVVEKEGRDSK